MSLTPPDSISTSAPYRPTNVKVLEVTAKFQSKPKTEQQLNIASCSAPGIDNPNSPSVSSAEQAVLRSEENIELATAVDGAISTGFAMADGSPTPSTTSREGVQIQQLHGDDSALPSTTPVSSGKPVGANTTNAVNISDDGATEVDCCSYTCTPESLAASTRAVSPGGVERQRLATEAVRGWQRRGSIISLCAPGVSDTAVGSQSIGRTSRVGGGRMGRRRARLSYSCTENDSSVECAVRSLEQENGTETNESGGGVIASPAVIDVQSCQGCKALQVANQRLNDTVIAMESKISKLSEMVTEINERLNQIDKLKTGKSSCRQSDEIFTDKRLMRIKAAAFITGRPLSAHTCKQLVLNIHDNEPPCMFDSDHIKSINDQRECRDAQSLSKWAVFELFSLQELVGRNCLGGGRDSLADGNAEIKKPFDECKMQIIKNAVFQSYPQQNDAMRKAVWMKCVDKINTDVRYLFKVSLKKPEWLQLGI